MRTGLDDLAIYDPGTDDRGIDSVREPLLVRTLVHCLGPACERLRFE